MLNNGGGAGWKFWGSVITWYFASLSLLEELSFSICFMSYSDVNFYPVQKNIFNRKHSVLTLFVTKRLVLLLLLL